MMKFFLFLPLIMALLIILVLFWISIAYGKGRLLEHYMVHYGTHERQQGIECGTLELSNGGHVRFLRGHPSLEGVIQEYEPALDKSFKAWDTLYKILCRKMRGIQ